MNPKLKKIGIMLLIAIPVIILMYSIAGLVMSESQTVTSNIAIQAPTSIAYKNIADFNQWNKWDPWMKLDTTQNRKYSGTPGIVGHAYSWIGNENVGEGSMSITSLTPNKHLDMDLQFLKPMKNEAKVAFDINENQNGSDVKWSITMKSPFYMRPMFYLFFKKSLMNDFDNGLKKLKVHCENEVKNSGNSNIKDMYVVTETTLPQQTYLLRKSMNQSLLTIGDFFTAELPKAFETVMSNKALKNTGAPCGFYYKMDKANNITDMAIAIPYSGNASFTAPYESYTLNKTNAIVLDYYGEYDAMEPAYQCLFDFIQSNHLTQNGFIIEEYVGDPQAVNGDMSKCLTRIYIPVK